ncbi:MAG TPA: hypothetical protein VKQ11_00590 [Candidatus Sulfotelmatobacter sp.]|nr:hypothetical protein [Candidatus Sulfotelmatobacter sp.]
MTLRLAIARLQQIRMTVFAPHYLAAHDRLTDADQTALINAIMERQEDTRRLDWLDANLDELVVHRDLTKGVTHELTFCSPESGCPVEKSARTLRDLVDNCMGEVDQPSDLGIPGEVCTCALENPSMLCPKHPGGVA